MANGGYFVEKGVDPSGAGRREFKISQRQVRHFMRYGPASKFFDSLLIPLVLGSPLSIFQGLEREDQEEGYCYVGAPPNRYLDHNVTVPAPSGMVFLVFVNQLFHVFEWRWEKMDPADQHCPINFAIRFADKLWPH